MVAGLTACVESEEDNDDAMPPVSSVMEVKSSNSPLFLSLYLTVLFHYMDFVDLT